MTLQWLIATYENHLNGIPEKLLPEDAGQLYLISQQDPENHYPDVPDGLKRQDVTLVRQLAAGLSKNRNHCLMHASGDILIVTDDDVQPVPDAAAAIRSAFEKYSTDDVLCFQIQTPEGKPYKHYPAQSVSLRSVSALKSVSSVEIAFRRKSIRDAGVRFDERFGIGAPADHGEELIFLNECLKKGLKIRFIPVYIGIHPAQSSVNTRPFYEDNRLFTAGAQNYCLYGKKAYLLHIISTIRRLPYLLKMNISPLHFLKMKNRGCSYITHNQSVCSVF